MGAGIGFDLVFGVILGTGVGGGIVINDISSLWQNQYCWVKWGASYFYIKNGNSCYCGQSGCVEAYISGPSLEKRWNHLTGLTQSMPEIINNFDYTIGEQWKR